MDWLLEKAIKKGDQLAGWSYPGQDLTDASNTHFAVVALHAAVPALYNLRSFGTRLR